MTGNRNRGNWDIFCTVVDNYGDIGVCWRLARQLAAEHGLAVRLWVDDLASFRKLCPDINPNLSEQSVQGVTVRHWVNPFLDIIPADVVIEAFACTLPENYQTAMATMEPKPVWINLEYLSAENWVAGCHGLPSPHPRLPLIKHFYFPGFTPATGGLLREAELAERRDAFQRDPAAQADFWASLALVPEPDALRVSLFGYENAAVTELLGVWAKRESPVLCLVPESSLLQNVAGFFGTDQLAPGDERRSHNGKLTVRVQPFLEQSRYDSLLWACDLNFVRGEDSLVRALWAGRPLVWHIYPQQEEAHLKKISAFMELYCAGLSVDAATALRNFWHAWNRDEGAGQAWGDYWQHRDELKAHARRFSEGLMKNADLAKNLLRFCEKRLE